MHRRHHARSNDGCNALAARGATITRHSPAYSSAARSALPVVYNGCDSTATLGIKNSTSWPCRTQRDKGREKGWGPQRLFLFGVSDYANDDHRSGSDPDTHAP